VAELLSAAVTAVVLNSRQRQHYPLSLSSVDVLTVAAAAVVVVSLLMGAAASSPDD